MSLGEWLFVEELDDAKAFAAHRQDGHGFVLIAFDHFNNFRRAPYAYNALRECQENAELGFFLQAAADHFEIARLKDVQGKVCAGEKDDVQWKERNPIGPHSARLNDTRRN